MVAVKARDGRYSWRPEGPSGNPEGPSGNPGNPSETGSQTMWSGTGNWVLYSQLSH